VEHHDLRERLGGEAGAPHQRAISEEMLSDSGYEYATHTDGPAVSTSTSSTIKNISHQRNPPATSPQPANVESIRRNIIWKTAENLCFQKDKTL
jgi:hypothetical protein